jgi:hypothetical protein
MPARSDGRDRPATAVADGEEHRNGGDPVTLTPMPKARTIARRRFPPWQVIELQGGYAVEDAAGHRLGVFYGRADASAAKQAGVLTLDEARQMAFDFATLPELLKVEGKG